MNARPIGFGGAVPEYVASRDLDGKGKRAATTLQNVSASHIEWLFAHQMIQKHHLDAGRQLQFDANRAGWDGYARLSEVQGGGGATRPSDAKLDAMHRLHRACDVLGGASSEGWRVAQFVVLAELGLREVERRHKAPRGSGVGMLRVALNVLARHYALI